MSGDSGHVTLIFYKLGKKWWTEPTLNLVAAAAQLSSFTHVEVAIGADFGANGEMSNVCRIFNDDTGCELTARTGRNPQYSYLQLGCSKKQELKMLNFARSCVGKPFSGTAMARSIIWPRKTDNSNFFCAELVAAVLKEGGLLDPISNPGAATPQSLHELYKSRATTTANPYILRQADVQKNITTNSVVQPRNYTPPSIGSTQRNPVRSTASNNVAASTTSIIPSWGYINSSNTSSIRVLNAGSSKDKSNIPHQLGLTFESLDFRVR